MVIILLSLISSQKGLPAQASLLGCLVMPSILDNGREKKPLTRRTYSYRAHAARHPDAQHVPKAVFERYKLSKFAFSMACTARLSSRIVHSAS